jgi:OmpA-OmpF porin, OOP family
VSNPIKSSLRLCAALMLCAGLPVQAQAQEPDSEGCKDHPLFNRMPGYRINSCETKEFDARDFPVSNAVDQDSNPVKVETVEGVQTYIVYDKPNESTHASGLQIKRNYQNAVKAAGGVVVAEFGGQESGKQVSDANFGGGDHATVLKLNRGGKEVWAWVHPYNAGSGYAMYIAEREPMTQAIVANDLLDRINKDGFIALYLNFDTGKATINPDSQAQLEQIRQMLTSAPDLKLEVAGHTDNVGKPEANKTLSQQRAQSVMKALTEGGVAAARLTAAGYGADKPLADNRSEDGRAKNRRVELVKK